MQPHLDNTSAWAVTAFIAIALLFDLRHDVRNLIRGRSVVLVSIFCWFLLEAVNLSPVLSTFSQATFNLAIFYVFVAAAAFLVGYHFTAGCRFVDPIGRPVPHAWIIRACCGWWWRSAPSSASLPWPFTPACNCSSCSRA